MTGFEKNLSRRGKGYDSDMLVGVLKEIKDNENRVAITPEGVAAFIKAGHTVVIEKNAGAGSGISNDRYVNAGAEIEESKIEICRSAGLILKIKEPLPAEYNLFQPDRMLFTFFHFASNRALTEAMLRAQVTCVAYETIETAGGEVPLLAPMSEIAGKMAPMIAAWFLSRPNGGKGVLASSVAGVTPATFVILGCGNAGRAAATVALGIGADVMMLDISPAAVENLHGLLPKATCIIATPDAIAEYVTKADVLIGAIHSPGAPAPKIISRKLVKKMEKGSVIVDIAIDQGGCIETSRPTTHSHPVYIEEGVTHYCVTNMPGIFPQTATTALTNATLPYALELANNGIKAFENPELLKGLNIYKGGITNKKVSETHNFPWTDPKDLLVSI